ncbi:MAG TPA: glutamate--tRNA ligase family protein [Gemmatimonadales bacterium]|nr:glutamate--tRNA ligase family protein [Gemmatimonadales bacterium]
MSIARLPSPLVTRFAPAPTGFLHLGHVANAVYVWGLARLGSGAVRLRIEDHDRQRARPEFEAAIRNDLEWLGLAPDGDLTRQSDRADRYHAAREQLGPLVYACSCSRRELAGEAEPPSGEELRYDGRCRERNLAWEPGLSLRVRLDDSVVRFDDILLGAQVQRPADQCGDLLIRDRRGNWTYQFAVTVDDRDQEISLVIRGRDLLNSTGRQIALARLLGRRVPPAFLHHPLLYRPDGAKLSKSNRDTGVRELRAAGYSAEQVIAMAARSVGLLGSEESGGWDSILRRLEALPLQRG